MRVCCKMISYSQMAYASFVSRQGSALPYSRNHCNIVVVKLIIATKVRIRNGTAKRQSHFSLFSMVQRAKTLPDAIHQEVNSTVDTKFPNIQ